jgi:hypothetical protein
MPFMVTVQPRICCVTQVLGTAVASLVHLNNPQAVIFTDLEGFENGVFRTATRQAIENGICRAIWVQQKLSLPWQTQFRSREARPPLQRSIISWRYEVHSCSRGIDTG